MISDARTAGDGVERNLREFVYLDELSVTSLLASLLGHVPSEFTRSAGDMAESADRKTESGRMELYAETEESIRRHVAVGNNTIVSKAIIQSTFAQLYDLVQDRLVLRPLAPEGVVGNDDEIPVEEAIGVNACKSVGIDESVIRRGSLAELEVELAADPAYRLSAVVSAFADLASGNEILAAELESDQFRRMSGINQLLKDMLASMVPVRCKLVQYSAVDSANGRRLVDRDLGKSNLGTRDIYLVGVAEERYFWRDVRRVLFSGGRFNVLVRLNNNGLSESWRPIKMANVMREFDANIADEFDAFAVRASLNASTGTRQANQGTAEAKLREAAIVAFAEMVAGVTVPNLTRERIVSYFSATYSTTLSLEQMRPIFDEVVRIVLDECDQAVAPDVEALSALRAGAFCALSEVGQNNLVTASDAEPDDSFYLDAEIVAIYW